MATTPTVTKTKPKSKPKALADLMFNWQEILAAALEHAASLVPAEPQRLAMEDLLRRARDLRARQESARVAWRLLTKEVKALTKEGEEAARRLQSAVKANIGTTSELLTQFKIKPNRPRGARKAKAPEETPSGEPTPASTLKPAAAEEDQP